MGNQQERLTSWFAGILDGEGTISAQVYTLPDSRVRITPFMCVSNTDQGILDGTMDWLNWAIVDNKHGKPRVCGHKSTHKECWIIRLDGLPCRKPLEIVAPYLRSVQKKRNAEVLLEYFKSRDSGLLLRDTRGRIQRAGYTRAEVELISSIRTHTKAKSSEAICSAPNVIG